MINKISKELKKLLFINDLIENGKVYLVGGLVRDSFLNKLSKDVDIVVCDIPFDKLFKILKKYGNPKYTSVGLKFGVIKFKIKEYPESFDIALPRREIKNNTINQNNKNEHINFNVFSDHKLNIESDLLRRDFTINSIAYYLNEDTFIDPFNGIEDIKKQVIHITNNEAFLDDPLRLMRGIQFAARFKFRLSNKTSKLFHDNIELISSISKERIIDELDKIFINNSIDYGLELLAEYKILNYVFGTNSIISMYSKEINTRADFYFSLLISHFVSPVNKFKDILKGDKITNDEINFIYYSYLHDYKKTIFNYKYDAKKEHFKLSTQAKQFILTIIEKKYPINRKEFALNGKDIIKIIGKNNQKYLNVIMFNIFLKITNGFVLNNVESISKYLKS